MSSECDVDTPPDIKNEFICKICNKNFKRKKDLKSHSVIHLDTKPFVCSFCPEAFKHKASMKRHVLIHSGEKPFVCRVCGKSFRQKGSLNEHMLTHTGEKPHSCEVCSMGFTTKSNYIRHLRTHLASKPYTCNLCQKGFNERAYLLRHYKIHSDTIGELPDDDVQPENISCEESGSNECEERSHVEQQVPNIFVVSTDVTEVIPVTKEYLCKVCNQKFKGFNIFKLHYLSHVPPVKEKAHKCNLCSESFKYHSTLFQHKLSHVQERLACLICGESFIRLVNLQRHFEIHEGYLTEPYDVHSKEFIEESKQYFINHVLKKSYICNICGKTFQSEIEFMHHSLVHKNLGPFVCDICNDKTEFDKLNELHKHYIKHDEIPCVCYACKEQSESKNIENSVDCKFFMCNTCHKCFDDMSLFKKHCSSHKDRRPCLIRLVV